MVSKFKLSEETKRITRKGLYLTWLLTEGLREWYKKNDPEMLEDESGVSSND